MTAGLPDSDAQLVRFAGLLADESRAMLSQAADQFDRAGRCGTGAVNRVEVKPDSSFVTDTDRAIEARLRELISDAYPQHGILGEEYGPQDLDAELVWVLDPIDGTAHFITGIPVYGTLVGLSRSGRPWLGVLDYPATADRWIGVNGVCAERNGKPVHTSSRVELAEAMLTCSNPDFFTADERPALARVRSQVRYAMYGASSFGFATLASGRTDLAVESGLKPYDVFAPAAVIGGAGGVLTDWAGAEVNLGSTGRFIAAGGGELHRQAVALLG